MQEQKRPEVRINGQMYKLRFDVGALEEIQEKFGGVGDALDNLNGSSMISEVRKLFVILANCQRDYDGKPTDITESVIGKHTSIAKLVEISTAIKVAIRKGMESETTGGGAADDESHDVYLEEIEAKNA